MPNTTLDKAIAAVPKFRDRISLFTKKLRLAQYADGSIYDYRLKIAQAVLFFRVLSQEQIARLIRNCSLYDKTLLAIIYDCALRVGEACRLRWDDICFDRKKLFVFQGKGRKDRYVPISDQMIVVLKAYRKKYPSDDYVFKSHGSKTEPQRITPGYVRVILKNALARVALDHTITIHDLRHSAATHLLENGENIVHVQKRLGHARLTTTMVYLHVADIEPNRHVRLIDVLFPPKQ